MRLGPHINISATCSGCTYCKAVYYRVQGDSGHDVYCEHPDVPDEQRHIGDTRWATPQWSPLLGHATEELGRKIGMERTQ